MVDFCLDFVWLWPNIRGRERAELFTKYIQSGARLSCEIGLDLSSTNNILSNIPLFILAHLAGY